MIVNTVNQYSYCIAEKNSQFKKALQESDILLPDGVGIVAAVRLLRGQKIKKISGAVLHQHLLKSLNAKKGSCFYLGSSEINLIKIKERLNTEFPKIKACFYSPPFENDFSELQSLQIIKAVNSFKPDVLFIGLTAPKQERWTYLYKDKLDTKIICCIGAVFDFYAGTIERPSKIWIDLGLEWFIRLIKEPKRMSKRYLYYGPVFFYYIFREKLKLSRLWSVISHPHNSNKDLEAIK